MTAGVWRLQERCEDLVIEDPNGRELAEVYQHEGQEDEGMAIARLMLAAPVLLAACQKAMVELNEVWHFSDCSGCETCEEIIPQLQMAIARATEGS